MLDLRRSTAAALLVGAAMVPALAAAPAYAVGWSSAAVPAFAAGWTFVATYPDWASCQAAGPFNPYAEPDWQCLASPSLPSAYELYVLL